MAFYETASSTSRLHDGHRREKDQIHFPVVDDDVFPDPDVESQVASEREQHNLILGDRITGDI